MPREQAAVTAPSTTVFATDRKPPRAGRTPVRGGRRAELALLALVVVLCFGAIAVARSGLFTAGSDVGYWTGVAGGVAMLLLFLYPLRKRWRTLRGVGSTRFWFTLHMTLGVFGPLLVIAHSTLRFGSVNATVAFASMALVASSGLVGRFLYGQIHHGLYGRRATLVELRSQAGMDSAEVRSKLAFVPHVERRLDEFAVRAANAGEAGLGQPLRFFTLGLAALLERRRCGAEAARALRERAREERWPAEKLARRIASRRALIAAHLRAVQRVAQFAVFERMFSWWHVLHVPLVYMMVLSAVAHVVAVHMY